MENSFTCRSDRDQEIDLFFCDSYYAVPKSDIASMEYPLFSVSTRPDMKPRRFEYKKKWIEIEPSSRGQATVLDKDVITYVLSHLIKAQNQGNPISRRIRFNAIDFLTATGRSTGTNGYQGLISALERICGTKITSNLILGGQDVQEGFRYIKAYEILRSHANGRMTGLEITLSDWMFNLISAESKKQILTLSRQYFKLRCPLARRIYEIIRKSNGTKKAFRWTLKTLQARTGYKSKAAVFKSRVKLLIEPPLEPTKEKTPLPDYNYDLKDDYLFSAPLPKFIEDLKKKIKSAFSDADIDKIIISDEAYGAAKRAAPGFDVYLIEEEWRIWMSFQNELPRNPDASFIGFVKAYFKNRRGRPPSSHFEQYKCGYKKPSSSRLLRPPKPGTPEYDAYWASSTPESTPKSTPKSTLSVDDRLIEIAESLESSPPASLMDVADQLTELVNGTSMTIALACKLTELVKCLKSSQSEISIASEPSREKIIAGVLRQVANKRDDQNNNAELPSIPPDSQIASDTIATKDVPSIPPESQIEIQIERPEELKSLPPQIDKNTNSQSPMH